MSAEVSLQTEDIVNRHLQAFAEGDLNVIMDDFSGTAIFCHPEGVLQGTTEIRQLFKELLQAMPPGSDIHIHQQFVEGEIAYLLWSGESEMLDILFARDIILCPQR